TSNLTNARSNGCDTSTPDTVPFAPYRFPVRRRHCAPVPPSAILRPYHPGGPPMTAAPPLYPGFAPVQQGRPAVLGRQWMVSTTHYLATIAGQRMLERGGNAIDAGVAAGLCINVLEPHLADFGGVAPIAVYLAETGEVATVSGLGRWPRKASTGWFREHSRGDLPEGLLRTVTPAAPDAWITALDRWGSLTFAEVSEPALQLARDGFAVWPELHRALKASQKTWAGWPGSAAMYLQRGRVPEV